MFHTVIMTLVSSHVLHAEISFIKNFDAKKSTKLFFFNRFWNLKFPFTNTEL